MQDAQPHSVRNTTRSARIKTWSARNRKRSARNKTQNARKKTQSQCWGVGATKKRLICLYLVEHSLDILYNKTKVLDSFHTEKKCFINLM